MCARNQSRSATSACSRSRISAVSTVVIVEPVIASAVAVRDRCPASAASPKNEPACTTRTIAAVPRCRDAERRTRPRSTYITPEQRSPRAKIVASGSNRVVKLAWPPRRSMRAPVRVVVGLPLVVIGLCLSLSA
jgi:hypothetical protein